MFFKILQVISIFLISTNISFAAPLKPKNFTEAKKIVYNIFSENPETLYCGCSYNNNHKIDHKSCSMTPTQNLERAGRTEIEHMAPMNNVTAQFKCGREALCTDSKGKKFKGRKCCQRISPKYRAIESELYNLWPSVGSTNQARGSYRFGEFNSVSNNDISSFDGCPIRINRKDKIVEPRDEAKGIVARANLFMETKHNIKSLRYTQQLITFFQMQST